MSKKRIGIAVMALGMFLWAAAAYASPEAPRLLSPPMALPVPSGFLKVLLLLTFFVHLVLVNVLLGSVILSVIDRRASASDRKGGVAFMPKVLALAVNFGVAPFLFLQVLYGHFLYPSIVLMAVWWMFVALFAMLAYYGLYVSDGAVRPARRTPILFLSARQHLRTAILLSCARPHRPPDVRGLFLGGDALSTAALILAVSGLCIALILVRQGGLKLASTAALGVILVMVCVRGMVRDAMLQPYSGAASPAPTALAMPHGQTAALSLFLVATVLVVAVLVWLGRVLFHALNRSESSEIREG